MEPPTTIEELVDQWVTLIASLNEENNEQVAYAMVGGFAGGIWGEWYECKKEPLILKVIDNAADLELPDGITIKTAAERNKRWKLVKTWVAELEKKYPRK